MSSITKKFLDSVNDVLNSIDFKGLECTPSLFLIASLTTVSITSFTSNVLVVVTSYISSLILIILNKGVRRYVKVLATTLTYVVFFSLVALTPLLINNRLGDYVLYVLRASAAATLLLASIKTLGWSGLSNAFYGVGLPALGRFVVMYVRMLSTLIKDSSKLIFCRDMRMLRNVGLRDMLTYPSLVGNLLVRGYYRGWRTSLAITARTMSTNSYSNPPKEFKLTKLDLFMTSVAITEVVLQLT